MHIKTGDTVEVISGENKGERGEVQRLLRGRLSGRQAGAARPQRRAGDRGGRQHDHQASAAHRQRPNPDRAHRARGADPHQQRDVGLPQLRQGHPVGHEITGDGKKLRRCKKCGETIE